MYCDCMCVIEKCVNFDYGWSYFCIWFWSGISYLREFVYFDGR